MRDSGYVSSVNPIIQLYFMPLFFFISGFFSEKLGRLGEFIDVLKLLISKGKSLLLPTAVMLTLSVFYFGQNFNSVLVDSYKGGYWFTYVLFCILSIYMSLSFLLRKFSNFLGGVIQLAFVLLLHYASRHIDVFSYWVKLTSADFVFAFLFYFYAGCYLKKYWSYFEKYTSNPIINTILFVVAFIPLLFDVSWYIKNFCRLILVVDLVLVFKHYACFWETDHLFSKGLKAIGKYTLEIYFLHYFLLFKIDSIALWLNSMTTDYCFRGVSCTFLLEIFIVGIIAVFISLTCVLIKQILIPFPLIIKLFFGK